MLYRKSSLIHAPAFSYGFERRGEGAGCVMYEQTQALHRPIPPSPSPPPHPPATRRTGQWTCIQYPQLGYSPQMGMIFGLL